MLEYPPSALLDDTYKVCVCDCERMVEATDLDLEMEGFTVEENGGAAHAEGVDVGESVEI
eukprot:11446-Rhodomonas_salina.2